MTRAGGRLTRLFAGRRGILLLGLGALFVSSACLGLTPASPAGTPTAPPGAPTAAATRPPGTPSSAAATPAAGSPTAALVGTPTPVGTALAVEGTVAFGPGAFNLTDPLVGLAGLDSYTATLKLSFTGSQAGKAQQWSTTYLLRSARQPAARQLDIAKLGDQADLDPVFMAEAAGAAYQRLGAAACSASVLDPANSLLQHSLPAAFLTGVIGAAAAGSDTVNGAAAAHYTFDEKALGQLGIATAKGELWVAASGGYLLKYVLTTQGDAQAFGDDRVGTVTLDYELTDVNQPVVLALPADCPAGLVTAPQLPDAANVVNVPGLLTYDTASKLAGAEAFYQQQLPGQGWTQTDDPIRADASVTLAYSQADQNLTVILTAAPAGTTVNIVLDRAAP